MVQDRQFEDRAMLSSLWSEAASETIQNDISIEEQADYYGAALADAVIAGTMSVQDLRHLVYELNELDRQVVERTGGELEALATDDYFEATARRVGHHVARTALSKIKTKRHYVRYVQLNRPAVGMGGIEGKDMLPDVLLTD